MAVNYWKSCDTLVLPGCAPHVIFCTVTVAPPQRGWTWSCDTWPPKMPNQHFFCHWLCIDCYYTIWQSWVLLNKGKLYKPSSQPSKL